MTDSDQAKAALAALADGDTEQDTTPATDEPQTPESADYRRVIDRATRATEDIDAAAEFVETVGLDRLEAAVETADHEVSVLAESGREALATFERFRVAAAGPVDA